jgi:hypothetical protein
MCRSNLSALELDQYFYFFGIRCPRSSSIKQSINQSINQTNKQSIKKSIN